jgi:hypothetical protein
MMMDDWHSDLLKAQFINVYLLNLSQKMEQLNKQINRNMVTIQSFDNEILNAVTPHKAEITISENGLSRSIHVVRLGVGDLKTEYGDFLQYDFSMNDQWGKFL